MEKFNYHNCDSELIYFMLYFNVSREINMKCWNSFYYSVSQDRQVFSDFLVSSLMHLLCLFFLMEANLSGNIFTMESNYNLGAAYK